MSYRNFAGEMLPTTNQAGLTYIKGSWSDETLVGTVGANEFEGGGGRDTFIGGEGDDYYWLRDPKDRIGEYAGGGIDTARIWSSYTLPDQVENLFVFGDGSYAAGNDLNNIIHGLDGAQFIYGGKGQDVLIGGGGGDTFLVRKGDGDKVIQDFEPWSDKVRLIGGNLTSFDAVKSAMRQEGADVLLNDGGTMVAFRNASIAQFNEQVFQLPLDISRLGAPTFNDDFNNLQTDTVWNTNFGYAGDGIGSFTLPNNAEQQIYVSPEFKGTANAPLGQNPFSINNSILTIKAQPASNALSSDIWGYKFTSGMLMSDFTQTYGYFEIRAELPQGQGLWPAFWMIGPNNNEIDILEGLGSDTKTPHTAIHSNEVPSAGMANFIPDGGGFHTYGALWSPSNIIFYADGTEIWRTPTPSDMDKPMQMIVNLAVGGPWAGPPDTTTPWPAELKVDYIRAYELPKGGAAPPTPPAHPEPSPTPPPHVGDQLLVSPGPGSHLVGGAGVDTLQASQGPDVLTGGAGADVFAFHAMPWNAGRVTDFQPAVDKLDLRSLYTGYSGSAPLRDGYVRFEADGAGGARVMVDPDGPGLANPWAFTVATLTGVAPGALTPSDILGAAGGPAPTPTPPPTSAPGLVLTAGWPDAHLTGGAGDDTLNPGQGAGASTGGAGADVFAFNAMPWSAGRITDFTPGSDRLDISRLYADGYSGLAPLQDGYASATGDGAGGARIYVDVDGPAGGGSIKFHVVTLDKVDPAAVNDSIFGLAGAAPQSGPGATPGIVLTSAYPGDSLEGGQGADTLQASQGADALTGGEGADRFVFAMAPWRAGRVTDFQPGTDVIDLRPLSTSAGYLGGDLLADGYLRLQADGAGNTQVLFDSDGWGSMSPWPIHVTTLEGVAPSALTPSDWLFG